MTVAIEYDTPSLLSRFGAFIKNHYAKLDTSPESLKFIWKIVELADTAGQVEAVKQCASLISIQSYVPAKRHHAAWQRGAPAEAVVCVADTHCARIWCHSPRGPMPKKRGYY